MRIILFTFDCFKGREHLMPWRTILEVAKVMVEQGYEANILNVCNCSEDVQDYDWRECDGCSSKPIHIYSVIKNDTDILAKCSEQKPEVAFIPFTFRDGLKPAKWIAKVNCKKIGYMAGGVYNLESGRLMWKTGGLGAARPYLMEAIIPKFIFARRMKRIGISHIVGLTDLTTKEVKKAGFKDAVTIYPGKDDFECIVPDSSIVNKYELENKKWLLFSGAPAPTRGAEVLLKALDRVEDDDIRLVMLMRTDIGSVYDKFEQTLSNMKHPERIKIIKDKLTREQLRAFFGSAWYALLPFIVIPSEVPLTYFELLSCGTPVITFANGGTTDYLKDALLIADKSVEGLAKALDRSWNNDKLREQLSEDGKRIMKDHPTWNQVGMDWLKLIL